MLRTQLLRVLVLVLSCFLALAWRAGAQTHEISTPLTTVAAASGLHRPVLACAPPGDTARLFILEQWTGQIRILASGTLRPTPFLDLGALITVGDDQGARSMAFHPDYAQNGSLFVTYIDRAGDLVLARFRVSTSDPDVADPLSQENLLTIDEPYTNHGGGMIAFGPRDDYLYMATGDGGPGHDPENRAQDPAQLLGKMLRLDVDVPAGYGIPGDNPFAGPGDPRDEIWAFGLRHPWRFSFDRWTGDLFLADVGQDSREEIDYQPAASAGGENYGWRCMEGTLCTGLGGCTCDSSDLVPPIHEYDHDAGCSVIGGYVYRGCAVPDLRGTYFFSDYCSERIFSFRHGGDGVSLTDFRDRTVELTPGAGGPIEAPFSFGEDALGELYLLDGAKGILWKIVPREPVARTTTFGAGWPGTKGVPSLTSRAPPAPCRTLTLDIGNSRGEETRAYLFVGPAASFTPSRWGGTMLVVPRLIRLLALPPRGTMHTITIPCDVALCQVIGCLQVVEVDPGASLGLSFSAGLELSFGDP